MRRFEEIAVATLLALACGACAAEAAPAAALEPSAVPLFAADGEASSGSEDDGSSIDRARAVPAGEEASVPGDMRGDRFFAVAVPAGSDGVLTLEAEAAPGAAAPAITVLDASGRAVDGFFSDPPGGARRATSIAASGGRTYFVQARGGSAFTLRTRFVAVADAFEPNDDVASARPVASGETIDLRLFAGHDTNAGVDVDFFRVVLAGEGTVRIQIGGGGGAQAFTAKILAEGVLPLGEASTPAGADLDATFALPPGARDVVVALTGPSSTRASKATFSVY